VNAPEWFKPGVCGAVIGTLSISIIGFPWGGWVSGGTSNERALAVSRAEAFAEMVPFCLEQAGADPEGATKLDPIRAASTYQRRDALMAAGWATVRGAEAPDRDTAQACLAALAP
jgi:hypothetical protein